jgi:ethanolamine ammonia-lyase small subunit
MKFITTTLLLLVLSVAVANASQKEQEITAKCIAKGGEASVISACIASELTKEEIKKCLGMSDGTCVGKNNEIRKALTNAYNDLTKGPGENNEVKKALKNTEHDLKHGPGPNNELCKHTPFC